MRIIANSWGWMFPAREVPSIDEVLEYVRACDDWTRVELYDRMQGRWVGLTWHFSTIELTARDVEDVASYIILARYKYLNEIIEQALRAMTIFMQTGDAAGLNEWYLTWRD